MDLKRAVWFMILFVVGFTYFMLVRYVRLPHLKVFIYALPPHGLWLGLYNIIKGVLIKIFGWVFMFFMVCTAIYWLIGKIPFKPIRKLLRKIPPLPILKRFGIFDFIMGLWDVIFSKMPFQNRILQAGKVYGQYIATNTTEFMKLLQLQEKLQSMKQNIRNQANSLIPSGVDTAPTPSEPSRQETMQRNANLPQSPLFRNSEIRKIDDEYRQCLEENTISPGMDASPIELSSINSRNMISRIVCKSRYLNSYLEELRN
jgi:hypothetical protein